MFVFYFYNSSFRIFVVPCVIRNIPFHSTEYGTFRVPFRSITTENGTFRVPFRSITTEYGTFRVPFRSITTEYGTFRVPFRSVFYILSFWQFYYFSRNNRYLIYNLLRLLKDIQKVLLLKKHYSSVYFEHICVGISRIFQGNVTDSNITELFELNVRYWSRYVQWKWKVFHTCEVTVILFSYKDYISRVLHYFV